jgi:type I restriction enzyme R subunit
VDFEVSLIHRDEINVGYILRLLAGIQAMPPKEQQEQKKKIMDIVDSDVTLRSKRELIDNFIEKSLLHATHDEDITQVFEAYVEQEKGKALHSCAAKSDSIPSNWLAYWITTSSPT